MADQTGIEWTDATWNPTVGCSIVSPGCTNCYAMKMAARIEAMARARYGLWRDDVASVAPPESTIEPFVHHYAGLTKPSNAGAVWTGKIALAPEATLLAPLRWKKPRRIFVNSMSDLFHEGLPDEAIDKVFAVMALAPRHTFQVLTKRAARMRAYTNDPDTPRRIARQVVDLWIAGKVDAAAMQKAGTWPVISIGDPDHPDDLTLQWPLPNVWLGVSIEDRQRGEERSRALRLTRAAVKFWSVEPLLGDLGDLGSMCRVDGPAAGTTAVDWVIVGGESGPGARPMHPDWARDIRDQCAEAGVAFFMKQMTGKAPIPADLLVRQYPGQLLTQKAA